MTVRSARQGARPARRALRRQIRRLPTPSELQALQRALRAVQEALARLRPPAGGFDLVDAVTELLEAIWRDRRGDSWTLCELADAGLIPDRLKGRSRRVGQFLAELADNERPLDRWLVERVTPKQGKLSTGHVWAVRRAF